MSFHRSVFRLEHASPGNAAAHNDRNASCTKKSMFESYFDAEAQRASIGAQDAHDHCNEQAVRYMTSNAKCSIHATKFCREGPHQELAGKATYLSRRHHRLTSEKVLAGCVNSPGAGELMRRTAPQCVAAMPPVAPPAPR